MDEKFNNKYRQESHRFPGWNYAGDGMYYILNIPKFNRYNPFFQKNYHDRVVRNRDEYWRIKKYIIQNPANWQEDVFRW